LQAGSGYRPNLSLTTAYWSAFAQKAQRAMTARQAKRLLGAAHSQGVLEHLLYDDFVAPPTVIFAPMHDAQRRHFTLLVRPLKTHKVSSSAEKCLLL
jgi:hypothetical protein